MPAAVLKVLAWRDSPLSEWFKSKTNAQKAIWMSALCGVKITETDVKNAKRRGAKPEDLTGSITELTDDDRRFLDVVVSLRLDRAGCDRHRLDALRARVGGGDGTRQPVRGTRTDQEQEAAE